MTFNSINLISKFINEYTPSNIKRAIEKVVCVV